MATLTPLAQESFTKGNNHFVLSKVRTGGVSDTFTAPNGVESVAVLPKAGDTAPTASNSNNTITLTGGTASDHWVITRHTGSAAGVGAQ